MIKKIRKKYLAWKNTIWVRLHFDELLAEYCNQIILVSHCEVVDSTPNFWGAEFEHAEQNIDAGDMVFLLSDR